MAANLTTTYASQILDLLGLSKFKGGQCPPAPPPPPPDKNIPGHYIRQCKRHNIPSPRAGYTCVHVSAAIVFPFPLVFHDNKFIYLGPYINTRFINAKLFLCTLHRYYVLLQYIICINYNPIYSIPIVVGGGAVVNHGLVSFPTRMRVGRVRDLQGSHQTAVQWTLL